MNTWPKQADADRVSPVNWSLPSRPLNVRVGRTALLGLQLAVKQSRGTRPHFCPGGLLLGACNRSTRWNIAVEGHFALEFDTSRGGAPFLTKDQKLALERALSSCASHTAVVGAYRVLRTVEVDKGVDSTCELPAGRALAEADRILLASCSVAPVSVGIRLEPPSLEPRGVVLWEDANLYGLAPASAEAGELNAASTSKVQTHPENKPVRVFNSAPEEAPGPRLTGQQEWMELPPNLELPNSNPRRGGSSVRVAMWFVATVLVSLLTYVGSHFYLKPMLLDIAARTRIGAIFGGSDPAAPPVVLGLKVERAGAALQLTWDRSSPVTQHGTSGRLIITDGTLNREIALNRDQLRSMRIDYIPITNNVAFRLEIVDSASRTVAESIRVLGGPSFPSYQAAPVRGALAGDPLPHRGSGTLATGGPKQTTPSAATGPSSAQGRGGITVARLTNPAPPIQRENSPSNMIPTIGAAGSPHAESKTSNIAPGQRPAIDHVEQNGPPFAQVVDPADPAMSLSALFEKQIIPPVPGNFHPKTSLDTTQQSRHQTARPQSGPSPNITPPPVQPKLPSLMSPAERSITPAKVLSRSYPSLLLHFGSDPKDLLVTVRIGIDKSGAVTSAILVPSGAKIPPYYIEPSLSAARRWRFSPAKVNGKSVPSEMEIIFHFSSSGDR